MRAEVIPPRKSRAAPLRLNFPATGKGILDALWFLVRLNLLWLSRSPDAPSIYEAEVVYEREPAGEEKWQTLPRLLEMGEGDCEDLAAARVAELIADGERARPMLKRMSGGRLWHVMVRREDGSIEDPSVLLGMPASEGHLEMLRENGADV